MASLASGTLLLVTGNLDKVAEFSAILGHPLEARHLSVPEVQSLDVATVARMKATAAYEQIGRPLLVDDSGIMIAAWNGLPGALTKWFLDAVGPEGILSMLQRFDDRRATASTAVALATASSVEVFTGTIDGIVPEATRGPNGFGYDSIFIPEGQDRTLAEMSSAEKNVLSMRRVALEALRVHLAS